jgi:1,4-alpha-glucan branching enzyme
MYAHPGKKLMFMGSDFGQDTEWNHDVSLPSHLLEQPAHAGIQRLVRDLNRLYRTLPALHALDCDAAGFEWLVADDYGNRTFARLRKGPDTRDGSVVWVTFTPQALHDYRVRVPFSGQWREIFNSDGATYGGKQYRNAGAVSTVMTRDSPELRIVVPPSCCRLFRS